jgi:hypothetical protein
MRIDLGFGSAIIQAFSKPPPQIRTRSGMIQFRKASAPLLYFLILPWAFGQRQDGRERENGMISSSVGSALFQKQEQN